MRTIVNLATGKRVLVFVILTNIVYVLMITITIPLVMKSANGMQLLDMMPTGYSASYIATLLKTLGEEGRHNYLFRQIPLDMIYPLLFGISYMFLIAYFMKRLGWQEKYPFVCLLPLFAGFFDYLENVSIVYMLNSYPSNIGPVAQIATVFTIIKSLFSTFTFIVIIAIVLWFVLKKRKATI